VYGGGGVYGVYGETSATGGTGVYGLSGTGDGVHGQTSGQGYSGVSGHNSNGTGGFGGYFVSDNGTGVFGAGHDYGVHGTSATEGVYGEGGSVGVDGVATGAGGAGVAGEAGPGGNAGAFFGNVLVQGNVSVTGDLNVSGMKHFRIDDPADPANKFLIHTSVESPQAENVYNGNLTTDARGYATVRLPSYFDAENIDPRYQLTVIGSFARAVVWKPQRGDQFTVRTDRPRVRVSWQVTGIRNDPYARSQRGPAEQLKPASERGRYLYPRGYGKPARMAIKLR
jgi:hypothetical protein